MTTKHTLAMCFLAATLLNTSACKKRAKPEAATPTAATGGGGAVATTDSKVVTDGAAHDLLLSLQRVHFALDTSELPEPAREALVQAAEALGKLPTVSLYVEGHTDDRGTSEYNIGLSERRARAVVDYLTRLGVAPARLQILPYGKEQPLAPGEDDRSRAKNRRVDFRVLDGTVELKLAPGVLFDDAGNPL